MIIGIASVVPRMSDDGRAPYPGFPNGHPSNFFYATNPGPDTMNNAVWETWSQLGQRPPPANPAPNHVHVYPQAAHFYYTGINPKDPRLEDKIWEIWSQPRPANPAPSAHSLPVAGPSGHTKGGSQSEPEEVSLVELS